MKYFYLFILLGSVTAQSQRTSNMEQSFDSLFQSFFKPGEPGGAVLLVKANKIIKGFGIADKKTSEPITAKTLLNIGSISKTLWLMVF